MAFNIQWITHAWYDLTEISIVFSAMSNGHPVLVLIRMYLISTENEYHGLQFVE